MKSFTYPFPHIKSLLMGQDIFFLQVAGNFTVIRYDFSFWVSKRNIWAALQAFFVYKIDFLQGHNFLHCTFEFFFMLT